MRLQIRHLYWILMSPSFAVCIMVLFRRLGETMLQSDWEYARTFLDWCNVSPSPTDVSPTEILGCCIPWTKCPFAILPLTEPSHPFDLIERSDTRIPTAARFSAAKRWSSICGPSVHPTEGLQSNKPGQGRRRSRPDARWSIRRRRPTEAAIAADRASSILDAVQGRDTSVRDTISKGRFVQGAQHPRIFGRGHIGRGHINPAYFDW